MSPFVFSIRSPLPPQALSSPSRGKQLPLVPHPHPICPHSLHLGVLLGKGVHLDKNLPLELVWRGKAISRNIYWFGQEHVPEDLLEILSHVPLLSNAAVVLNGQNNRETGRRKRAVSTSAVSGWNQRLLSFTSKPGLCALREQFASTAICAVLSIRCNHPTARCPHCCWQCTERRRTGKLLEFTQSLPSHNFFLREISLWLGDTTTRFLPTESQACGLMPDLWIKVGFTLLQPWLYPLFAFLAALLAEVQVPAVLTRR